jgi:hypothetical protein
MDSKKYIGMHVHKETISIAGDEFGWKSGHGKHHRNESEHDSAVLSMG